MQGSNADFIFHLEDLQNSSSSLPFTIASDGTIILSDPLDFEETESYLFMVGSIVDVTYHARHPLYSVGT